MGMFKLILLIIASVFATSEIEEGTNLTYSRFLRQWYRLVSQSKYRRWKYKVNNDKVRLASYRVYKRFGSLGLSQLFSYEHQTAGFWRLRKFAPWNYYKRYGWNRFWAKYHRACNIYAEKYQWVRLFKLYRAYYRMRV